MRPAESFDVVELKMKRDNKDRFGRPGATRTKPATQDSD